jgi:hypothetical protein
MDSNFTAYLQEVGMLTPTSLALFQQIYNEIDENDLKMIGPDEDALNHSSSLSEGEARPSSRTRMIFALADFLKFQSNKEEDADAIELYDMAQAIHENYLRL